MSRSKPVRRKIGKADCNTLRPSISGGQKFFIWDTEVPGFGIYRTSTGIVTCILQYRMRKTTSGQQTNKQQRYRIGTVGPLTIDQARDRAKRIGVQILDGIDPIAEETRLLTEATEREGLRVGNYWSTFLESRIADQRPVDQKLVAAMVNDVLPRIGDKLMPEVTFKDLETMKVSLSKRSKSAWRRAIEVTKLMFNHAKKAELVDKVATDKVATPKSDRRSRFFNRFELTRYLEAVSDTGGSRGDALHLLLLLCRRLREVTEMVWDEVDQHNWTWLIPDKRTKNGLPLFLQLPRQAVAILERQEPDRLKRQGLVFRHDGIDSSERVGLGDGIVVDVVDAHLDRRIELWADENGVARPNFPYFNKHDSRTTIATNMQAKPLSILPHIIERLLHHVTGINGLRGVYQLYQYADEVGEALQRWADFLDELIEQPDCWPGGRDLPVMPVDERERRALNLRADWTERKKLYKSSAKAARAKRQTAKAASADQVAESATPSTARGGTTDKMRPASNEKSDGRRRNADRRGIVKAISEASEQVRLHPRSTLAGHEDLLREMVAADPEATLEDIRAKLANEGIIVSAVSTIWRCLAQLGIAASPAKQQQKPEAERRKLSISMKAPPKGRA